MSMKNASRETLRENAIVWFLLVAYLMTAIGMCVLVVSMAKAATFNKLPCSPVFLAGNQGRPLPDAVVAITTRQGVSAPMYADPAGTIEYSGTVPVDQVLQVFATDPDVYQVVVTASGMLKDYWMVCGYGVGTNLISVSRPAKSLEALDADMKPTFNEGTGGKPSYWSFFAGEELSFDFVSPSFAVTFTSLVLSTFSDVTNTSATDVWQVNFCTYAVGDERCDPDDSSNTAQLTITNSSSTGVRKDLTFTAATWDTFAWDTHSHVVVEIELLSATAGKGNLENVVLEAAR